MSFAYPLPWWAFALVLAGAAALAWYAYRGVSSSPSRRLVLTGLRFVTLMALVIVLMRPVVHHTTVDGRDVVIPILVDTSRSMAIDDADGVRRIDRARDFIKSQLLPGLGRDFQVEVLSFGEALAAASADSLSATARRSDLGGALAGIQERFRGRPVAGVILISDGADTGGGPDVGTLGSSLPPVFPFGVGSLDAGGDREILSVTAAETVLDGSRVDLDVSALSSGRTDDTIELRLLENGQPREVRHVRVAAGGGPIREIFHVSPPAGAATVYTIEIPPASEELVPENNSRSVLVQPSSRTRRVLLVEGAPGFEHSFLKRALAGDRGINLDSVVRKGKNEQGADTYYVQATRGRGAALATGYPTDAATLFTYDALVFANVTSEQLSVAQLAATRDFVSRRGGGLLVLGAQSFLNRGLGGTAIEDALPVELSRRADPSTSSSATRGAYRVALTDAGRQHPITRLGFTEDDTRKRWDALPALAAAASLGMPRPGASVLATTSAAGASRPLIAVQRYGEGRSMIFTGEASWRWRMMLPSTDRSYDTFWRQSVRWLSLGATDPVAVFPAPAAGPGESVVIRTAVRDATFTPIPDADVTVRLSGPDGRMVEAGAAVEEGETGASLFAASFTPQEPGLYRVSVTARKGRTEIGTASSTLLVGGADLEMAQPRLNAALLQRLASQTGGHIVDAGDVGRTIAALQRAAPAASLASRRDIWHSAWSLLFVIGLLAAEWLLRRQWGLR
ncbi:MAG TPA: glutamine amidotransferase [Vicinamibacterales bacterium]|nr:glutamine amidotransferase [Vicinamibacterales bacterium]